MDKKKTIIAVLIFFIFVSGCSTIHVGGSGRIGGVTGSGGVNIPVPQKEAR